MQKSFYIFGNWTSVIIYVTLKIACITGFLISPTYATACSCSLEFWLQGEEGGCSLPYLGTKGGFAAFVSVSVGEGAIGPCNWLCPTQPRLQFHICPLAEAMSINASFNKPINTLTTLLLLVCIFGSEGGG